MIGGEIESGVNLVYQAKAEGCGVYGLSNWSVEIFPREKLRHNFFKMFDGMIVSGYVGEVKSGLRNYELLLKKNNLKADECLFIDDNEVNLAAARKLGIHPMNQCDIATLVL